MLARTVLLFDGSDPTIFRVLFLWFSSLVGAIGVVLVDLLRLYHFKPLVQAATPIGPAIRFTNFQWFLGFFFLNCYCYFGTIVRLNTRPFFVCLCMFDVIYIPLTLFPFVLNKNNNTAYLMKKIIIEAVAFVQWILQRLKQVYIRLK
jgi:hypothetical protein